MELKKKQEDLKRRKKQMSEKDLAKMGAELVSAQQDVLCMCVFGGVRECREGLRRGAEERSKKVPSVLTGSSC